MEEKMTLEDEWRERLLMQMTSLDRERMALDANDPKYTAKVIALARQEKELQTGLKNYCDLQVEKSKVDSDWVLNDARNEIEKAKIESEEKVTEARNAVEVEKIATESAVEEMKLEHEKRAFKIRSIIEGCGIVVAILGLVHAFMSLFMKDRHLEMLNDWNESGNAAITAAQKFAVNDALKDERPWKF